MDDKTVKHIFNVLRRETVTWHVRKEVLRKARKKVFVRVGLQGQKIFKFFWKCAMCREWFRNEKEMEVDHIEEIGPFIGPPTAENIGRHVMRIYCDEENLRALCIVCHSRKTSNYNAARRYKRKG